MIDDLPILDKSKIVRQFNYLTSKFDLNLFLRIVNSGPTGICFYDKKLIEINQNKPFRFSHNEPYVSWTFVLCHEIRHAIQIKYGYIEYNLQHTERRFKGKLSQKVGDPDSFLDYLNRPEEKDANNFARIWESRLERLNIK